MKAYFRQCVSLPIELKEAMDKHKGTNWSKVASSAFAEVCGLKGFLSFEERIFRIEKRLDAIEQRRKK